MDVVDLVFPIVGARLPSDNGYHLFAAISRTLGGHVPKGIAVSSVGGPVRGERTIELRAGTLLRIRTPADRIGELLSLVGVGLDVGGHQIELRPPRVRALTLAATLHSRIVSIKGYTEPEGFLAAVGRQMSASRISGSASIPVVSGGTHEGAPQRRVVRIKGLAIIGFALIVEGLSAEDSARLLIDGLGGRRHMGCGIFAPAVLSGFAPTTLREGGSAE